MGTMIKYTAIVIALLMLLSGCGILSGFDSAAAGKYTCANANESAPPVSEDVLHAAWEAQFGNLPDRCGVAMHWSWQIMKNQTVIDQSCGFTRSDTGTLVGAAGCTVYSKGENGSTDPGCPATLTTAHYARDTRLAAHEIAHALRRCVTGDPDANHADAAIYGTNGFVARIVARFPPH